MRGLWAEAWKERGRKAAAGLLQGWGKTGVLQLEGRREKRKGSCSRSITEMGKIGGLQLEGRREREESLAYIILSNF